MSRARRATTRRAVVLLDHRLAGVVVGHPGSRRPQGQGHEQVVGRGPEQPLRDVAQLDVLRRRRRLVEQHDRCDPVEPEQPDPLDAAAPRLEVGAALDEQQAHRVDVALGRLVARRDVVGQVQRAGPGRGRPGRPAARGSRPPPTTATRCAGPAAAPAACSTLASARSTASRSTSPGVSASARSATTRASASSTVRRRGRVTPAGSSSVMVSPSNSTSMRSPGPCPGSPHTHSRSRSLRSRSSVTPNVVATSARRTPGRASR